MKAFLNILLLVIMYTSIVLAYYFNLPELTAVLFFVSIFTLDILTAEIKKIKL